jgi:hypothetical protein
MTAPDFDHTAVEKRLIREFGGTPAESFGPDGTGSDGDPVEVRVAKKEDRFRVNKSTHDELVAESGSYIFDDLEDNKPPKQVEADTVDDMLGTADWHSDRGYKHRFLDVDSIFPP